MTIKEILLLLLLYLSVLKFEYVLFASVFSFLIYFTYLYTYFTD